MRPLDENRVVGWVRDFTSLLFPAQCAGCGDPLDESVEELGICAECIGTLRMEGPSCRGCGQPFAANAQTPPPRDRCLRCARRDYRFSGVFAAGVYEGRLAELVRQAKWLQHESVATAMGTWLGWELQWRRPCWRWDWVVPVPMLLRRRLVRGYNQAHAVAAGVAAATGRGELRPLLWNRRKLGKQGTLSPTERFQNARGAFGVKTGYALRGARVLLVDDILTTGATASAAAAELRSAGVRDVRVAVVARAAGRN
ncbi:MAG: phosphoribosyltransferase family protein [Pirellulaceae bacterium]|nr:phosphoribosyltransferase family protein [Pirellulaceae bacterium]MDP7016667.1 phosphoribosyltransferase family protein [Pirellulaceae bacterium]